jgi:hypothetical protein
LKWIFCILLVVFELDRLIFILVNSVILLYELLLITIIWLRLILFDINELKFVFYRADILFINIYWTFLHFNWTFIFISYIICQLIQINVTFLFLKIINWLTHIGIELFYRTLIYYRFLLGLLIGIFVTYRWKTICFLWR